MRKVIRQCQNNSKALELRLEEEANTKYYLVLAGISIKLRSGCASGRCEAIGEEDYQFVDNETYMQENFPNYPVATQAFDDMRKRYIDY